MAVSHLFVLLVLTASFLNTVITQSVVCPAVRTTSGWLDLFPLPCKRNAECSLMGAGHLCCKGFCTKGVKGAVRSEANVVTSSPTTSTTTTSTTTTPSTTTSTATPARQSLEAALRPFLQFLPIQSSTAAAKTAPAKTATAPKTTTAPKATLAPLKAATGKSQKLVCPKPGQAPIILFPIPCEKSSQCRASSGADQVCCDGRCIRGVAPPKPKRVELRHQPLLGVIPRECPSAPLGELLFEVQPCKTDADCWPRVCCPDGAKSYCRTAKARLDLVPIASTINRPVRMIEQYLQCTPPPQYDLFPRKCTSSVDCFPNLCCAEGGQKHCRPPQRSLIALLAGVTQRVGSTFGNIRQNNQANKNNI